MRARAVAGFVRALTLMQWTRGLRAGAVIASIAAVCGWAHRPLGWACVGGFLSIIVDNGGPYRSRLVNMATLLAGGTLACFAGSLGAASLVLSIVVTAGFCFSVTLARVLGQALASTSVAILVCYFAAFGTGHLSLAGTAANVGMFLAGGAWAAVLTLFLWPVDPFRPAREAVADCYETLTLLAEELAAEPTAETWHRARVLRSQLRAQMEAAQDALSATPARMTSRTIRARNLAVLLQAADLLFVRVLRLAELADAPQGVAARGHMVGLAEWMAAAMGSIAPTLREAPVDGAASFAPDGSRSVELRRRRLRFEATLEPGALEGRLELSAQSLSSQYDAQLAAIERDCLLNFEVAFEAVRAIWSGVEPRATRAAPLRASLTGGIERAPEVWVETLRANFSLQSNMMRHALRLAAVTVADVLLMRRIHVTHGFWLAMTSIVVLQPYTGQTLRRFAERVGGTVAGGIVAAVLASALPNEVALMGVVIVFAMLSAAVYSVDYGWYCFFLTPTFVLLAMPHLRDWHFAVIRIGMTGAGAATALLGMMLLWRERESLQMPGLLGRAAAADAAYLRAMLRFWEMACGAPATVRGEAERTVLGPARRACGLATTDAEESLDRALLEPNLSLRGRGRGKDALNGTALTFTTYLRRLTQSITTLAAICDEARAQEAVVGRLAERVDGIAAALVVGGPMELEAEMELASPPAVSLAGQQLRRMERQIAILERAAAEIAAGRASPRG
jgi:uncharacterized membrane protein YccC